MYRKKRLNAIMRLDLPTTRVLFARKRQEIVVKDRDISLDTELGLPRQLHSKH